MNYLEIVQTVILIILLDRSILIRKHYKFAIETQIMSRTFNSQKKEFYFAFWIYCKMPQQEGYGRYGGRRLFYFKINI